MNATSSHTHRASHALARTRLVELVAFTFVVAAVVTQCFVEPIVGTADNRDYWRVLAQLGLSYPSDPEPTMFWNLVREWNLGAPQPIAYLTSQVWIGKLALALNPAVGRPGMFDIRAMGLANAALYLAACAALVFGLRGRTLIARLVTASVLALVLSDVRIVAYFNSFLSESAQAIFFVATAGFAYLCSDPARSERARMAAWLAFVLASASFILAKNQDATYAAPLAVAAYALIPPRAPRPRLLGPLAALSLALLPVWAMASGAYAATTGMNVAVTLHEGILPLSPDPAQVIAELGGDLSRVTLSDLVRFYLRHPRTWLDLVLLQSRDMHSYLPFGNFSKPLSGLSQSFDAWSELKKAYYPRDLRLGLGVVVAYSAWLLRCVLRATSPEARGRSLFELGLLWGSVLQFLVVTSLEANGPAKHFFIFNLVSDCLLVLALARMLSARRPVEEPAPQVAGGNSRAIPSIDSGP